MQPTLEPACIPHTDLPGTSRLFADFSYHFDRVSHFYRHDPYDPRSFQAAAAEIAYPAERRAAMVRALAAQNGPSDLLTRFAQPDTAAVVTGQQVGLFSGPAYTIYKALTAARLASDLSARGIPAVPVFWLATEDHDFPEVDHVWIYDQSHQPVRLNVGLPAESQGRQRPVGAMPMADPPVDALRRALADFPYTDEVMAAVEQAYAPGATMGAGFRTLLKNLLGRVGMLVLDPLEPSVRAIGAPFMADALAAAPDLKAELLERNREITQAGYHAQVHIEPKTSIFFLLDNGERVTLRQKDSEFAALRDRAADISGNAVLRPVWQDYLLPTVAYVGGPAELAYLAQSRVIYERLLGRMPVVLSRCGFTLLDSRASKLLERYRMTLTDTLVHEESLKDRIAEALIPASLKREFQDTAADFAGRLDRLGREIELFDHTLSAALAKSRAKILYQLEKTRRKVERETLRRDVRASSDARYLSGLLYPHRHLQERFYSILPFLAQHGMDLVDRLYDTVQLECPDHRILTC
jgi:bacillithiol biosynthesis cysteine-adding enzyme BshC